ncbi:MAG TPA: glycoside hydrolase family 66 protein [Trueperaceae bacterium]
MTKPGEPVTLRLEVENNGQKVSCRLSAELRDLSRVVASESRGVGLEPGRSCLEIQLRSPAIDGRGYEAMLRLDFRDSSAVARTAVLVASHWRVAPRYGFLSEFAPGESGVERVRELSKFHVNVVQFYDWVYRHYRFLPPQDEFVDAMGRSLSLTTVRARVDACHAAGMAAIAYGAVYGPEPEFVDQHPEWVLRDAKGDRLSLIDLFYITDIRPDAPWREHILREFESALTGAGFDGIHMDQYGFPKWSYDAKGEAVDLAEHFPGLIDEAAQRVGTLREGAAVIFNAVNNWPIERVAGSDQAAVYIEVWPSHERYRDLVELVTRARYLSNKQVILAAYLEPFREECEGAEHSALLTTAVIASAGGFHLLLGEGTGVLRDPYYANHGRMRPEFSRIMRRYYDHTAACHHYLFADSLQNVAGSFASGVNEEIALEGAPFSVGPESGAIWLNVRQRGSQFVINLVNLAGAENSLWNVPKERPRRLEDLTLLLSNHFDLEKVVWSSPDDGEAARELAISKGERGSAIALPGLDYWATVVIEVK